MRMKHALGIMALLYFCFALKMRHVYAQDNKTPMFRDDFEYDVSRNARNAEVTFRAHGWTDAKANNTYFQRGAGYLYTQYDPLLKSRVLVMESLPSRAPIPEGWRYAQTDYWLKYGEEEEPLTTIPANVWFQFWTYATPESRFDRLKFLYPSRGVYPASRRDGRTDYMWLLSFQGRDHTGKEGPPGSRFLAFEAWHAERGDTPHDPSQRQRDCSRISPLAPRCSRDGGIRSEFTLMFPRNREFMRRGCARRMGRGRRSRNGKERSREISSGLSRRKSAWVCACWQCRQR